jgi:hypothetical protein
MAYFPPTVVVFDDGNRVEIQTSSRDMLALEKEGIDLAGVGNVEGGYIIAHATLKRYERQDRLGFSVPDTWEGLADCADLEPVEDADVEGKDSGQAPSTG